jgi:hypothetical protein
MASPPVRAHRHSQWRLYQLGGIYEQRRAARRQYRQLQRWPAGSAPAWRSDASGHRGLREMRTPHGSSLTLPIRRPPSITASIASKSGTAGMCVRISEVLDSRFTKSRTGVSLSPGQSAQFGHRCLVVVQAVMISAFSMSVKRGAGRLLRMLSPSSVMRWALCTRRSRMASAIVGAPIISCH